MSKRFFLTEK